MEIIWSDSALNRVEDIGSFIAQDSPVRAAAFVNRLIESAERLAQFPHSGSITPENPAFRQIVFEGCRTNYRTSDKNIQIKDKSFKACLC